MKNNKLKKLLNGVLASTMAMSLCMGSGLIANAADVPTPSTVAITKVLQMADGTTTPKADFQFSFTAKTLDAPEISVKTLSSVGAETGTVTDGMKSVVLESGNIFAGITFPHAGEYVYSITENADTYTIDDPKKEEMTYSKGAYEMHVYVENDGAGGTKITAVGTIITITDNKDQTAGKKVDPTPSADGSGNELKFTNTYVKKNGGTDVTKPEDQSLNISKTVAGAYGDQKKAFSFDVTVNKAATIDDTTCEGYILGTDGKQKGGKVTFTYGTASTIALAHGEKIAFVNLPVGTTYSVTEKAVADYTPTCVVTENGKEAAVNGEVSTALSVTNKKIGEATNSAAFTNTYKQVTPTGILVNNLPFVMMIVVAISAFALFVISKRHKSVR